MYRQSEKKLLKQQCLFQTSPQYGIFGPLTAEIGSGGVSKFQRVSRLAFVTASTLFTGGQPNFARCLTVSCAATL